MRSVCRRILHETGKITKVLNHLRHVRSNPKAISNSVAAPVVNFSHGTSALRSRTPIFRTNRSYSTASLAGDPQRPPYMNCPSHNLAMAAYERHRSSPHPKLGSSFSSSINDSRPSTLCSTHAAFQETPALLSFKITPLKDSPPYAR